ncbi:MAG: alpha/beta fold hydrolase, partial [Actinomycetota bacterium]
IAAARLPQSRVVAGLNELFADPSRVSQDWYDAAVDDFLTIWRSPSARIAFFAALRSIYLEEPYGEAGFWGRLASMRAPALYLYGRKDHLITPRFGPKVAAALPSARVIVWDDCGHVPQIEHPDRTVDEMLGFFAFARGGLDAGAAAV